MDDDEILGRIRGLADEERRLEESHSRSAVGLSAEEKARLDDLQVTLDQLWDVLRQRRALRRAGRDPDEAVERPPKTVERYEQ